MAKRKRGALVEKDKEKRTAKLEGIHRRLNPFDIKVTKLKHEVGGRKLKGVTGKPAHSKQAGIEQVCIPFDQGRAVLTSSLAKENAVERV
jgi:hypothetical protein